ncbi:phosphonate C-P lyase system protein PhnH [Ruegeria sp.]|uniref:phosphonate C-P lyase system protein PhnH n=1 Tax=Ruegeria sp. TaxID=1879320 RepID=UPI003C79E579
MIAQTQFSGGFQDASRDAAYAFRAAMTVLARPGEIRTLAGAEPPEPLSVAAGTLLLTLCDADTGVYLAGAADTAQVRQWLTFHTGAPFVTASEADFAVGSWVDLMPLRDYRIGTPEYPDRSTTLIVERDSLQPNGAILRGPGIKNKARLSLPDVTILQGNAMQYPLGCDFFFTAGDQVAGLPRSTQIEAEG